MRLVSTVIVVVVGADISEHSHSFTHSSFFVSFFLMDAVRIGILVVGLLCVLRITWIANLSVLVQLLLPEAGSFLFHA